MLSHAAVLPSYLLHVAPRVTVLVRPFGSAAMALDRRQMGSGLHKSLAERLDRMEGLAAPATKVRTANGYIQPWVPTDAWPARAASAPTANASAGFRCSAAARSAARDAVMAHHRATQWAVCA
jgi:hypothetical protein